jgi:hypothetical protein
MALLAASQASARVGDVLLGSTVMGEQGAVEGFCRAAATLGSRLVRALVNVEARGRPSRVESREVTWLSSGCTDE